MGHIASFRHAMVGDFLGIPVYKALQGIEGEFSCAKNQLLIGGGGAEHPALVIKHPAAAVVRFLNEEYDDLDLDKNTYVQWGVFI